MVDPTDPAQSPSGCRHIEGDPRTRSWRYCQAPTRDGASWCDHHRALVFAPCDNPLTPREIEKLVRFVR